MRMCSTAVTGDAAAVHGSLQPAVCACCPGLAAPSRVMPAKAAPSLYSPSLRAMRAVWRGHGRRRQALQQRRHHCREIDRGRAVAVLGCRLGRCRLLCRAAPHLLHQGRAAAWWRRRTRTTRKDQESNMSHTELHAHSTTPHGWQPTACTRTSSGRQQLAVPTLCSTRPAAPHLCGAAGRRELLQHP